MTVLRPKCIAPRERIFVLKSFDEQKVIQWKSENGMAHVSLQS
jgi:hypothetical protein